VTTGCGTTNKSTLSAPVSVAAQTNLYANVDVGDQISGTAMSRTFLTFLTLSGPDTYADGVFGGLSSGLKAAAAYDAISKSGADIIVNPQYVVVGKGGLIFQTTTVDVTGFKGIITSIEDLGPASTQTP